MPLSLPVSAQERLRAAHGMVGRRASRRPIHRLLVQTSAAFGLDRRRRRSGHRERAPCLALIGASSIWPLTTPRYVPCMRCCNKTNRASHWWWIEPTSTLQGKAFEWNNALRTDEVSENLPRQMPSSFTASRAPTSTGFSAFPSQRPVIWVSWGDDYYRVLNALNRSLFLPWTAALNAALGKMSITVQRLGSAFGGAEKRIHPSMPARGCCVHLDGRKRSFWGFQNPSPRPIRHCTIQPRLNRTCNGAQRIRDGFCWARMHPTPAITST